LIIGTGKYNVEFEESFYKHFREYKMLVEIMPTVMIFNKSSGKLQLILISALMMKWMYVLP
jgi:hypothetical protein